MTRGLVAGLLLLVAQLGLAQSYDDMFKAVRMDDADAVSRFLQRGFDPNTTDKKGNTLLMIAAHDGAEKVVDVLLKARAKVNARNQLNETALMLAAIRKRKDVVEKLVQAKAMVNKEGWSPLAYAAFGGDVDIVRLLIAQGANLEALSPNRTSVVMMAVYGKNPEVLKELLRYPLNLDHVNDVGGTALKWALEQKDTDMAEMLRKAGATR